MPKKPDHISTKYAKDAINGKVIACKWVKLACQRHLDDLRNGHERGLWFDKDAADYALDFFSELRLWKGRDYKGKEFVLAPHYKFIVSCIMGWKNLSDDTRRFQTAYIEMARKGAKSTVSGGLGAYYFIADGEHGAEIYCCAVKIDQAKIVWENIKNLTKQSIFASLIKYPNSLYVYNLSIADTWSKCEAVPSDPKSMDGFDTHFASLDVLHAHPTPLVFDLVSDSIGTRKQPLILIITTAGFDQSGVCYSRREYLTNILKGVTDKGKMPFRDDSFFGIIYTLDTKKDWPGLVGLKEAGAGKKGMVEDDYRDEKNWVKALPGLCGVGEKGLPNSLDENGRPTGYMTKIKTVRNKFKVAQKIISAQNNFLTKWMNIWTQQFSRWIDIELWDRNYTREIDESKLKGRRCTGGIDLSATDDLTVWVMLFPDLIIPDLVDVLIRVWCTKNKLYDRTNKYAAYYQAWEKQGYLTATDGNAIDYKLVRKTIVEDSRKFNIDSVAVDRYFQGIEFSEELDVELGGHKKRPKVFQCGLGYASMAPLMPELERRLLENQINHGGNPILRWMVDNVAVTEGPTGIKKVDKSNSQGKIDGIIGILLALDRLTRAGIKPGGNDGSLI